jgi:hypothetical protein
MPNVTEHSLSDSKAVLAAAIFRSSFALTAILVAACVIVIFGPAYAASLTSYDEIRQPRMGGN